MLCTVVTHYGTALNVVQRSALSGTGFGFAPGRGVVNCKRPGGFGEVHNGQGGD